MLFTSLVPHAQIKYGSRDEPGFCHAQKEANDEEPSEALTEAHEDANDAPDEGESRQPEPRSREFERGVTRHLEQDVTDKVDGQRGEVLVSDLHFERL